MDPDLTFRLATLVVLLLLAVAMTVLKTRWQTAAARPILDKRQSLYFEGCVFFVLLWLTFYSFARAPLLSVACLTILGFHAHQLASGKRFAGGGVQDWITLGMHLVRLAYALRFELAAVPIFAIATAVHVLSLSLARPFEAKLKVTVQ